MPARYNYKFNLNEIFEIAEQIERNGADFYRKAALKFEDNLEVKSLLIELAVQEDKHEKTFSNILRKVLKSDGINFADELTCQYLDVIAGQFVFDKSQTKKELINEMSQQNVFDIAIQKEKDSIVFYVGLKNTLISSQDKKSIDLIIREEQKHLVDLIQYAEILRYKDERF
jgi:rubrerythrin